MGKKGNKSQFVLTTNSEAKTVRYRISRYGRLINQEPSIVHQYNWGMGGIYGTKPMIYTYLDERKCLMKPWKNVIFNVIGRMVFSSYVLYKLTSENPMSH